jgi:hypothetical protein
MDCNTGAGQKLESRPSPRWALVASDTRFLRGACEYDGAAECLTAGAARAAYGQAAVGARLVIWENEMVVGSGLPWTIRLRLLEPEARSTPQLTTRPWVTVTYAGSGDALAGAHQVRAIPVRSAMTAPAPVRLPHWSRRAALAAR